MTQLYPTQDQSVKTAILVGVILPHEEQPFYGGTPLEELEALAETAGVSCQRQIIQRLHKINATYYLGKGKAHMVAELAEELEVDLIIFDGDLAPSQQRNLEKLINKPIVDRTELILNIFAQHARTKLAKLQVELAQMIYTLPRLKRMWSHLSRIEGTIGGKGPGEKQIEVDRRLVRKRITDLKRELKVIQERKERQVNSRHKVFTAALVGYTNAGKSTLMNRLTEAEVLVQDKLFATLDTRTRVWGLTPRRHITLSDTVGFISKIPHHLVASFHATLEEVTQADLLLHVVDLGNRTPLDQIESVNKVLKTLKCDQKKILMVFNKVDRLNDPIELNLLKEAFPNNVVISARDGKGLDQLTEKVLEIVSAGEEELEVLAHVSNGQLFHFVEKNATVLDKAYEGEQARILLKIAPRHRSRLEELMKNGS